MLDKLYKNLPKFFLHCSFWVCVFIKLGSYSSDICLLYCIFLANQEQQVSCINKAKFMNIPTPLLERWLLSVTLTDKNWPILENAHNKNKINEILRPIYVLWKSRQFLLFRTNQTMKLTLVLFLVCS